jgi:hypothetical protein
MNNAPTSSQVLVSQVLKSRCRALHQSYKHDFGAGDSIIDLFLKRPSQPPRRPYVFQRI